MLLDDVFVVGVMLNERLMEIYFSFENVLVGWCCLDIPDGVSLMNFVENFFWGFSFLQREIYGLVSCEKGRCF